MAKVNFKGQLFRDLAEKPITREEVVDEKTKETRTFDFTLAEVIQANLLSEDREGTPTDRFNKFLLAEKIKKSNGDVEVTVEELALIKKTIGNNPSPLVVGRVWQLLESLKTDPFPLPIE